MSFLHHQIIVFKKIKFHNGNGVCIQIQKKTFIALGKFVCMYRCSYETKVLK